MMRRDLPIPLHPERPNLFHPIHEDDLVRALPALLGAARVPATIVNWAGSETVSIEEPCRWLGEQCGLEPRFQESDSTIGSVVCDTTRMRELAGETRVPWRDGLRRMLAARHPEPLRAS